MTCIESTLAAGIAPGWRDRSGWPSFLMAVVPSEGKDRFAYATQMPGTATFLKRCGEAVAEDG